MAPNQERLIPISDVVFKTDSGKELYRLTALKVKLKLANQGIKQHKSLRDEIIAEVGATRDASDLNLMLALLSKINEVKGKVFREQMVREQMTPSIIKFLSCERCALVSHDDPSVWRVTYYRHGGLSNSETVHRNQPEAEQAAQDWVTEAR